jgi:hypothetical protein
LRILNKTQNEDFIYHNTPDEIISPLICCIQRKKTTNALAILEKTKKEKNRFQPCVFQNPLIFAYHQKMYRVVQYILQTTETLDNLFKPNFFKHLIYPLPLRISCGISFIIKKCNRMNNIIIMKTNKALKHHIKIPDILNHILSFLDYNSIIQLMEKMTGA